jgi:hypothetical protein
MISMAFSEARIPFSLETTHRSFPVDPWPPKRLTPLERTGPAVKAIPVFKKFLRDNLAML